MSLQDPRLELVKRAPPYTMQTHEALTSLPEPEMLITGFLPKNAVVGITAPPGVGKTWLMMELMRSACYDKFLGKYKWNMEFPRVLFVGSDASIHDYARQWRRIYAEHHAREQELDRLYKYSRVTIHDERPADIQIDFLLQSDFMLDDINSVARLISTARTKYLPGEEQYVGKSYSEMQTGPGEEDYETIEEDEFETVRPPVEGWNVIIFDTLSRLTRANQNDNTEMENVFRNIRFIAEQTGATCILLHHNSKKSENNNGEDWRGAVGQIGALDCWLQLRPTKNDKYVIQAEFKKFRGITPEPFLYHMNVSSNGPAKLNVVDNKTERTVNFDLITQKMYEFIVTSPTPVTRTDIDNALWGSCADIVQGDRAKWREKLKARLKNTPGVEFEGKTIYMLPKETDEQNELRRYHWTTGENSEED